MMATAVDEGIADVEELVDGSSRNEGFAYTDSVPLQKAPETTARFRPGDRVMTRRDVGSMHTRLTGYVRGRAGVVESVIGFQALPDDAATGIIGKEQTYVVRFPMAELWPEASDSRDSLLIDLWDSYLEPA